MLFTCLLIQLALVVGAVQVMGRRSWRRNGAVFLLIAALLFPLYVPLGALPRAVLASLGLLAVVKVLQLARQPEGWSWRRRLWHSLVPFDLHRTSPGPRQFDRPLLLSIALHGAVALLALLGLWLLPRALPIHLVLARMVLGAALVYAAMESITETVRFVHGLGGVRVPQIQVMPIFARSLREFWSERWNKPVSDWLNEFIFLPVSRRSNAGIGLLAAFAVSGASHAWVFFIAVGWIPAAMGFAFFIFQGLFVMVESAIRLRRMPVRWRRAWTLGMLAISSPLFVEPVLLVLGL